MEELILHENAASGNCYKIRLTAALLGFKLERREYNTLLGETRTPEFLTRVNSNGRIPVLEIGTGQTRRLLPESNAACFWLADGSHLIPSDRFDRADMLRWMFFEQYSHEPNVATLRWWLAFVGEANLADQQRVQMAVKKSGGDAALKLMDEHLAQNDWMVGNGATLADIALYAYTHVCEEGGAFHLADYPAVGRWLRRMADLPGYVAMD